MDDRRCLVVDKQAVVREGVRRVLDPDFEIEEASGLPEAMETITATGSFDVAVVELDYRRPDNGGAAGSSMIKAVRKAMPGAGIVALAQRPEQHGASAAIDAGASAYVAKSSPADTIRAAVEAAAESSRFVDPEARGNGALLTRRQSQTIQLLADGLSTADAAHRLGVSGETIRTHTKAALARLGARDRAHAVAIALRSGIID